ncbi:MAG TPA: D-amino acid aminotransferase [Motiliproteus sp.]
MSQLPIVTPWVYLNGRYVAKEDAQVSVFDRGFLFADSVYEVVPYYNGKGFRLEEHCARLQRSLTAVSISIDLPWDALLNQLVERNGGGNLAVYLQVTRGNDGYRYHHYSATIEPTVVAYCYPLPSPLAQGLDQVQGIAAALVDDLRWQRCDIKATGLMANVMALQQALAQGAQEALLVRDGFLTEGSACNLLLVRDGCIYTPPKSAFILGGTTRDLVLELAAEAAIPVREQALTPADAFAADELWITSSTRWVIPVLQLDGRPIGDGRKGPLWHTIAELFRQFEQRVQTQ